MTKLQGPGKLRIALFSGNYNNVLDGANLALNRLTDHLLNAGHAVRVFSPTIANPAFEPKGQLYSLPSVPIPGRSEYRLAYRFGAHTKAVLNRFAPDIIHVSAPDLMGHAARRYARRHNIPVVSSFHTRFETYLDYYGLAALKASTTKIATNFYNSCDEVLVPSTSSANALRADGVQVPLRRWTRGIDTSLFSPGKRSEAWRQARGFDAFTPTIIFVGRLVKEKGLDLLIGLAQALNAKSCRYNLVVAGEGPQRNALTEVLQDAHFTGHLQREDLAQAYANADIFFNPSDTETFGNVTLEAMASGLACVASDAGGSKDLVVPGRNGLLAKARDLAEHVQCVEELLMNDCKRRRFGCESRVLSEGRRWDTVLNEVVGHYLALQQRYCCAERQRPSTMQSAGVAS
ncbi:MAG: glycosyltransferase family 1 protein [Pseudomonadota bacterium]